MSKWKKENAVDESLRALLRPGAPKIQKMEVCEDNEKRPQAEERQSLTEGVAAAFAEAQHLEELHRMLAEAEAQRSHLQQQSDALLIEIRSIYAPIAEQRAEIRRKEAFVRELRFHLSFFVSPALFERWLQDINAANSPAAFRGLFTDLQHLYERVVKSLDFFELRPHIKNCRQQLEMLNTVLARLSKAFSGYFEHEIHVIAATILQADKKDKAHWLSSDHKARDHALGIIRQRLNGLAEALSPDARSFLRSFLEERRNRIFKDTFVKFYIRELWSVLSGLLSPVEKETKQLLSSFIVAVSVCAQLLGALLPKNSDFGALADIFVEIASTDVKTISISCRHITNFEEFLKIFSLLKKVKSTPLTAMLADLHAEAAFKSSFLQALAFLTHEDESPAGPASVWVERATAIITAELETYLRKWLHLQALSPELGGITFGALSPATKRVVYLVKKSREFLPHDVELERIALEHHSQAVRAQADLLSADQRALFLAQNLLYIADELQANSEESGDVGHLYGKDTQDLASILEELRESTKAVLYEEYQNISDNGKDAWNEHVASLAPVPLSLRRLISNILTQNSET